MIRNFKDFLKTIIVENLHPELQDIIKQKSSDDDNQLKKQTLLSQKIFELNKRGEKTGIEGNMPKGSSRAYLQHQETHDAVVDGKPTKLKTGTKIAISASFDKFHKKEDYEGMSLGEMQNDAEAGDKQINSTYRILRGVSGKPNHFETNKNNGIFPPLIGHDDNNQWSHVGHVETMKGDDFRKLTVTKEYPKGISHNEFSKVLNRNFERSENRYFDQVPSVENYLDHLEKHPLIQKFKQYHDDTHHPAYDYGQLDNMGVWQHPDGSKHIVARDHGYNTKVAHAYHKAAKGQSSYERGDGTFESPGSNSNYNSNSQT
jgi:hypothetical protein